MLLGNLFIHSNFPFEPQTTNIKAPILLNSPLLVVFDFLPLFTSNPSNTNAALHVLDLSLSLVPLFKTGRFWRAQKGQDQCLSIQANSC